jgi:hypothetical protein
VVERSYSKRFSGIPGPGKLIVKIVKNSFIQLNQRLDAQKWCPEILAGILKPHKKRSYYLNLLHASCAFHPAATSVPEPPAPASGDRM